MYLLDTNLISETRRIPKINAGVAKWLKQTPKESLYTCAVVMMELERGVLGMERKDPAQGLHLRRWLEQDVKRRFAGRILPIDEDTATICARLHVPDRSPENDAWIAAIAIQHHLTIVTRNVADFTESGAKLLNPFEVVNRR
ncbi:type II toxin-antitoxin system VapC family toxin [uncultured Cardiobacterium sp.]|uniref:type II toxin-antitoxin system VapC family toxin n=1 Tax=uncultured Cardiobacterium sp. TaxID=417619 RepID=UPI0026320A99|nr:type II toxin-antitoxin system VapC family toxin [uncultured Cardiobacterium sp.]